MAEDNSELLGKLMGMLGDNPEEKISAALSNFGIGNEKTHEEVSTNIESGKEDELDALLKIGNLLSTVNGEDERSQLLTALKPFLSESRRPKIDNAVKLLKLAKMAEAAGKNDILKNFKL